MRLIFESTARFAMWGLVLATLVAFLWWRGTLL